MRNLKRVWPNVVRTLLYLIAGAAALFVMAGFYFCYLHKDDPYLKLIFSSHKFQPHDSRLEVFVEGLNPVITKIETYHQQHGSYPDRLTLLQPKEEIEVSGAGRPVSLRYFPNNDGPDSYAVGIKLDFDTFLLFKHTSSTQNWVIDDGVDADQIINL